MDKKETLQAIQQLEKALLEILRTIKTTSQSISAQQPLTLNEQTTKLQKALADYPLDHWAPQHLTQFANISLYLSRTRRNRDLSWQQACNSFMSIIANAVFQHPYFSQPTWQSLIANCQHIDYPSKTKHKDSYALAQELASKTQELADQANDKSEQYQSILRQAKQQPIDTKTQMEIIQQSLNALALSAATFVTADIALSWRTLQEAS